ncbi:MAG: ATP-binding protein [Bacteroidetes bacterium]|jgi:predicted ATP-dependent endonuclease of OLD family|nr:ATP-binding protein [Bacteroidota bacterium]
MRIIRLKYEDLDSGWTLSNVSFNNTTLLVGASGVGKTQILEAIMRLKRISSGASFSGLRWELEFITTHNKTCLWTGHYESKGLSYFQHTDENERNLPKIISEQLLINSKLVIDRDKDKIVFHDYKIPKLSPHQSALNLLKAEEMIKPIFSALQNIIFTEHSSSNRREEFINTDFLDKERLLRKYKTLESIRESEEKLETKLFLAFQNSKRITSQIKERFISVFPFVEDIRFCPFQSEVKNMPPFVKDMPFIQLKELNVDKWIPQFKISSGMFRTLMQISAIYLCSEGTVLLIDEFENSLGINCLDELTSELLSGERRSLQFIITSHHPYIINRIDVMNWKIVTRRGSLVKAQEATRYIEFDKSKQKAFIQLTQLDEFTTGIER